MPDELNLLRKLYLRNNQFTHLTLPDGLVNLRMLYLDGNQLTNLILSDGLYRLQSLWLSDNHLTSLTLPDGLGNLESLFLDNNQLTNLRLPNGLNRLEVLRLWGNQLLAKLYVPAGTSLPGSIVGDSPLDITGIEATFYTNLRGFTRNDEGDVQFTLYASAGDFLVQRSFELQGEWSGGRMIRISENEPAEYDLTHTGAVEFRDQQPHDSQASFYRILKVEP